MRLINVKTLQFEEHEGDQRPAYAILSHRWEKSELTYREACERQATRSTNDLADPARLKSTLPIWGDEYTGHPGLWKTLAACRQALRRGLDYLWTDTCCIDKSSSAELQEAINSMYEWYRNAEVCYAYLSDVEWHPGADNELYMSMKLKPSQWGWTLQELLAPRSVVFFDKFWNEIGRKHHYRAISPNSKPSDEHNATLNKVLTQITGIPVSAINFRRPLETFSVAQRMSWAANRKTTRIEDRAYSLLGLFDVKMPMLYGEGSRAFRRLQEEIIRLKSDHSLFAWSGATGRETWYSTLLAPSPECFRHSAHVSNGAGQRSTLEVTSTGLQAYVPIISAGSKTASVGSSCYALLNCRWEHDITRTLALPLRELERDQMRVNARTELCPYETIDTESIDKREIVWRKVTLLERPLELEQTDIRMTSGIVASWLCLVYNKRVPALEVRNLEPISAWHEPWKTIRSYNAAFTEPQTTSVELLGSDGSTNFAVSFTISYPTLEVHGTVQITSGAGGECGIVFQGFGVNKYSDKSSTPTANAIYSLRNPRPLPGDVLAEGLALAVSGEFYLSVRIIDKYLLYEPVRMIYLETKTKEEVCNTSFGRKFLNIIGERTLSSSMHELA